MKLSELENLFVPCYVLLGFIYFALCVIALVLFFNYYDKSLRIRKKEEDNHIKDIVRKELENYDNNVSE